MRFVLLLHTTAEWDLVGRLKGQTDIPLNSKGREEARQLAQTCSNLDINLIVSSDLKRASETAQILNIVLQTPLNLNPGLRECSFGSLEGLTRQQAIEKYGPIIVKDWDDQNQAYDFKAFGGEDRNQVLGRHLEVIDSLSKTYSGKVILLVGHGRGMSTLLAGLGYEPDIKRGEYRIIEYNPGVVNSKD